MSPALRAALERLRTRFGVGFELLTPALQPWFPAEGGDLYRALGHASGAVSELTEMIGRGRTRDVEIGGEAFVLQPLRASGRPRRLVGLLAVRKPGGASAEQQDEAHAERWADMLRTFIDADLECSEEIRQERQRGRRTWAAVRFLGQLLGLQTEQEVTHSVVHAAAVWFDVDARVYRRELSGRLILHTRLPGVDPGLATLDDDAVAAGTRPVRLTVVSEALRWASPEALVIPLRVLQPADWVLVVGGSSLSTEAEELFVALAQGMAAHLERLAVKRRAAVRNGFEALLLRGGRAPSLAVLEAVRRLMQITGAVSGVLTLERDGLVRRLAAFGTIDAESTTTPVPGLSPTAIVLGFWLPSGDRALLDLRSDPAGAFTPDAALLTNEAAAIIQLWLAGNVEALRDPFSEPDAFPAEVPTALSSSTREEPASPASVRSLIGESFVERIEEELARARRFDLGLSMLLVDLNGPRAADADTARRLLETIRGELRGSDVLGLLTPSRIAVLLVHTDVEGVASVMPRVRRCLAAQLASAGIPEMRLGRAVMSDECDTVTALLTQASRDVEAIAS